MMNSMRWRAVSIMHRRIQYCNHRRHVSIDAQSSSSIPPSSTLSCSIRSSLPSIPVATSLTSVRLSSGHSMPLVGYGTWRIRPADVDRSLRTALDCGYRHIDNATVYGNEIEVGATLNAWLASTNTSRSDIFVTSKLWNTCHAPHDVEPALRRTLARMNQPYIDLYLIHWPVTFLHRVHPITGDVEQFPKSGGRTGGNALTLFADVDTPIIDTWRAMIHCQRIGLVRSIGVSNFSSDQVRSLVDEFGIDGPSVNQVESHPYCGNHRLQINMRELGVHMSTYSPLGNILSTNVASRCIPSPLYDPIIVDIASRIGVTTAQLLCRWQLQLGRIVLTKSVDEKRIKQNGELFHFNIDDADMKRIEEVGERTKWRYLNPTSFKRTPKKYFFTEME